MGNPPVGFLADVADYFAAVTRQPVRPSARDCSKPTAFCEEGESAKSQAAASAQPCGHAQQADLEGVLLRRAGGVGHRWCLWRARLKASLIAIVRPRRRAAAA